MDPWREYGEMPVGEKFLFPSWSTHTHTPLGRLSFAEALVGWPKNCTRCSLERKRFRNRYGKVALDMTITDWQLPFIAYSDLPTWDWSKFVSAPVA